MGLLAPFLIAGFEPIPTTPVPPATGDALDGLVVAPSQGWDTGSAARLSEGDDIAGTGASDVNVRIQVCCPRTQTSLPVVGGLQCTAAASSAPYCDPDETLHTVTAWEDGPSITTDGATLLYNYSIVDFAQVVTCFDLCTNSEALCTIHCGDPIYGPLRDGTTGDNRILETALVSGVWSNSAATKMNALDAANVSDRAPSAAFDATGPDLYLSELVSGAWATPVTIDDDPDNAPYINTDCEEENPHLVRDADGLRLYFESNRKWYFDDNEGTPPVVHTPFRSGATEIPAASQPNVPWDDAANDCVESMRNLFVTYLEDGQSDWTEPVRVNIPDAVLTGASWADIRKAAPFVTPGNPAEPSGAPRGRQIYWLGRANDCHLETSTPTDDTKAALGCIYRAEQSGDQAIGAAWTNVTKILTPTPILYGALGDVVVVTNPSVTGDRSYLYFTYIERGKAPADVEPPVNLADSIDDTDPQNPPTDVNVPMTDPVGLLIGDAPYWQNWRFTKGLAHPANYDAGSGDTTGWEDSVNISADGRHLYFGYNPWILGQGLYAGPDYCADPFDASCRVGRRVVPRILTNSAVLRSTGQAGGDADAGVGVNIFEATIGDHDSNSATPNEWIVTFSEVNFEHYCGTGSHPDCLSEDTVCLNDIFGEVLTAGDPLADPVIPKDAECFTSKDQGYNEGAVTVSTADDGVDHMVFVRYGDIAELVPSAPLTSPPETVSWRMYTSTRNCGTSGSGTGTHWCTPVKADFTIDDSLYTSGDDEQYCDDNDPHLTAHGTSVYFDTRRYLIDKSTPAPERCVYKEVEDMRVYHTRQNCDQYGAWGEGSEWCPPTPIIGGPNIEFLDWQDDEECAGCDDDPPDCPLYCAPEDNDFYTGRKAWRGHQPFVPEDESGMWFVGDGRDCIDGDLIENPPEENPDPDKVITAITTSCLYYAKRSGTDYVDGNGRPWPTFDEPFPVVRAQVQNALPCRYGLTGDDPDVGKITGLGEPSVTKDGKFFYFAYIRKLASGEPLDRENLPECSENGAGTEDDDKPSDPGQPLCKCAAGYKPDGCWMQPCLEGGTPDETCKAQCTAQQIDGSDEASYECLPASVLYCQNPAQSQSLTDETEDGFGVDVFEFNIAVARRESWDPSVGVVSASQ